MLHESTLSKDGRKYCPPCYVDTEEKDTNILPGTSRVEVRTDTGNLPLTQLKTNDTCKKMQKKLETT